MKKITTCLDLTLAMRAINRATNDRFDRLDALYWYCADHHRGQYSAEYRVLCAVGTIFRPSPMAHGPDSAEAIAAYNDAVEAAS